MTPKWAASSRFSRRAAPRSRPNSSANARRRARRSISSERRRSIAGSRKRPRRCADCRSRAASRRPQRRCLQRAAEETRWPFSWCAPGGIEEPRLLRFAELASGPARRTNPARMVEGAGGQLHFPRSQLRRNKVSRTRGSTQFAARWFHKKPRAGEIFFAKARRVPPPRSARRGERAPQQRVAVPPHSARVLASACASANHRQSMVECRG